MSKAKNSVESNSRACVLILGMHRSGTSALAGVLSRLGCAVPANPMPASKSNAKGFFESTVVRDFNDELLASTGSSWDDFTPFHEDWLRSPEAADFFDKALSILEGEFGEARLFVLKDPRICRLVPFWSRVLERFGSAVRPILTVRNPLEVAHSMYIKRNFSEPLTQMIWLRHALDAESATRGLTRFHTSFEQLMDGWDIVAQQAESSLQLAWPKSLASIEFDVAKFLTADLKHHRDSPVRASTSALLPSWLREAYEIFNGWARTGEMVQDHARLDRIKAEFDAASQAFGRVVRAEREASLEPRLRAEALEEEKRSVKDEAERQILDFERSFKEKEAAREAEREALQAEILAKQAARDAEREALQAEIIAKEQDAAEKSLALQRSREDCASLEARLGAIIEEAAERSSEADQRISLLKKSLQEQRRETTLLNGEVHQLKEAKEAVEAELQSSRARRKEMARVIARRDAELEQRYRELAALELHVLHSRTSWRIKRMIRKLIRWTRPGSGAVNATRSPIVGA